MRGIIIKEFLAIKTNVKLYFSLLILLLINSLALNNWTIIFSVIPLVCITVLMNSLSYDESTQWEEFAILMGVSRLHLILSKYLLIGILSVFSFIITVPLTLICKLIAPQVELNTILFSSIGGILCLWMIGSILIPLFFKYGLIKAQLLLMVVASLPFILLIVINKFMLGYTYSSRIVGGAIIVILVSLLLLIPLSSLISFKVLQKKEYY